MVVKIMSGAGGRCPVSRGKRLAGSALGLNEHQSKQIQARADLIALGIAPDAPWKRVRREAQEQMAEVRGCARRLFMALEDARLAREPKPDDEPSE
jgi:hypothetical protein